MKGIGAHEASHLQQVKIVERSAYETLPLCARSFSDLRTARGSWSTQLFPPAGEEDSPRRHLSHPEGHNQLTMKEGHDSTQDQDSGRPPGHSRAVRRPRPRADQRPPVRAGRRCGRLLPLLPVAARHLAEGVPPVRDRLPVADLLFPSAASRHATEDSLKIEAMLTFGHSSKEGLP